MALSLNKLTAMFAEVRGEQARLEKRLDECLRRREDLHSLPLPREDFAKIVDGWIDQAQTAYPSKLRQKLESFIDNPLKVPNWGDNGFNPLMIWSSTTPDPAAFTFLLKKQIRAGVAEALAVWDWPEKVGPPQAERFKELEKLDKEITDLQQQLETIKRAARGQIDE